MYNLSELLKENDSIENAVDASELTIKDNARGASVEFKNVVFKYKSQHTNKFNEDLKDNLLEKQTENG